MITQINIPTSGLFVPELPQHCDLGCWRALSEPNLGLEMIQLIHIGVHYKLVCQTVNTNYDLLPVGINWLVLKSNLVSMCFSRKSPPLFITVILSYNFFADGPIFGNKCFLFPISVSLHQILGAQIICDQKYWNHQRNSVTNTKEDSPRTALWRILQKKILRQRELTLKLIGFQKAFRMLLNLQGIICIFLTYLWSPRLIYTCSNFLYKTDKKCILLNT